MDMVDQWQLLLGAMVRYIPTLTIEIIGLWFAYSRRSELGRASTYAVWGFSLLIASALLGVIIQHLLVVGRIGEPAVTSSLERTFLLGIWNLAAYLVYIVGLAALARAVFVGRKVSRDEDIDSKPSSNAV